MSFVAVPSLVCICCLLLLLFHPSPASVICSVQSLVRVHSQFPPRRHQHPWSTPDMLPLGISIISAAANDIIMSAALQSNCRCCRHYRNHVHRPPNQLSMPPQMPKLCALPAEAIIVTSAHQSDHWCCRQWLTEMEEAARMAKLISDI